MSLHALRTGQHVRIGPSEFVISQRLAGGHWQLQNTATGEWCRFGEDELLDRFARNELSFVLGGGRQPPLTDQLDRTLQSNLSAYPPEMVALAANRVKYLKEIDRRQPMALTPATLQPLIRSVSEEIKDTKPPGWLTLWRNYRKWVAAGRDIRVIVLRHADQGKRGARMAPEVKIATEQVIKDLYLKPERKRVPEVHLEIVRRLDDANQFRQGPDRLRIPSQRTIYREIARLSPYTVMAARYGKRCADMEFRVSATGPVTIRPLERVVMDHTPSDLIVVDDDSMLPLGRPTITTALDEHTRCPMGFYSGFEPPSCLAVMRCLKHAILPKTYLPRQFPSVKNHWECYGVPELLVVDNPPEFHSSHFELACLQIGCDIQYAKVLVPWYKGKIERFLKTLNHDLMHGSPGTTFSNILERDDYDPSKHAVVLLGTFREILHKWIVDVYLETPHRGIKDTPIHRWRCETNGFPPPLPPSPSVLDVVLGMTVQRVVFHYGIELEGLKYNSPELGELRRRMGSTAKVELTFDPGDLGRIHVFDPLKGTYICVPALNQAYASGLSLWQNRVIRRYAQDQLHGRTDIVALAQAKAEIRALIDRDFNRKSIRGRKRHARFMENHAATGIQERVVSQTTLSSSSPTDGVADGGRETQASPPGPFELDLTTGRDSFFTDDDILPVFEAALDLPRPPAMTSASTKSVPAMEKADD